MVNLMVSLYIKENLNDFKAEWAPDRPTASSEKYRDIMVLSISN